MDKYYLYFYIYFQIQVIFFSFYLSPIGFKL